MGPAEDVGIDFQPRGQVAGHGAAPEADVNAADAFVAVDAEVVQGERQLPAVALTGPADDQLGHHRAYAELVGRVEDAPSRYQDVEGRGADMLHAFGEQRQAVGKSVLMDRLGQVGVLMVSRGEIQRTPVTGTDSAFSVAL